MKEGREKEGYSFGSPYSIWESPGNKCLEVFSIPHKDSCFTLLSEGKTIKMLNTLGNRVSRELNFDSLRNEKGNWIEFSPSGHLLMLQTKSEDQHKLKLFNSRTGKLLKTWDSRVRDKSCGKWVNELEMIIGYENSYSPLQLIRLGLPAKTIKSKYFWDWGNVSGIELAKYNNKGQPEAWECRGMDVVSSPFIDIYFGTRSGSVVKHCIVWNALYKPKNTRKRRSSSESQSDEEFRSLAIKSFYESIESTKMKVEWHWSQDLKFRKSVLVLKASCKGEYLLACVHTLVKVLSAKDGSVVASLPQNEFKIDVLDAAWLPNCDFLIVFSYGSLFLLRSKDLSLFDTLEAETHIGFAVSWENQFKERKEQLKIMISTNRSRLIEISLLKGPKKSSPYKMNSQFKQLSFKKKKSFLIFFVLFIKILFFIQKYLHMKNFASKRKIGFHFHCWLLLALCHAAGTAFA